MARSFQEAFFLGWCSEHADVLDQGGSNEGKRCNEIVIHCLEVGDPRKTCIDGVDKDHGTQNARDTERDPCWNCMSVYPETQA